MQRNEVSQHFDEGDQVMILGDISQGRPGVDQ